jgi:DNA-binding GntR family transcriptional regulator
MDKLIYTSIKNNYHFSIYKLSKKEYIVRIYEIIKHDRFIMYEELSTSTEREAFIKLIELMGEVKK